MALAYEHTGRWESERNAEARRDSNKRTAGEIAKSLRKKGYKVSAKEVQEWCFEYHHAGFYKNSRGKKVMRKVWYSEEQDDYFIQMLDLKLPAK